MILPFLLSGICLVATYYIFASSKIHRDGQKLQKAPNGHRFLGHALKFTEPRHELFDWFVQCQKQFGFETLEISIPTLPPSVIINSPENLEFVLKNEHLITKGEFFKKRSWDLFGHGIINATGELWKIQRKVGLKFFSGKNVDDMVSEALPEAYNRIKLQLAQHAQNKITIDMQKLFHDLTTRVVCQMAYEMDIDSSHPFSQAFDYASDRIGLRFQNPLYQITEFFTGSRFREAVYVVKQFGRRIVSDAKKRRSQAAFESLIEDEQPVFHSLIDSLLETFTDPNVTADSALNFLSAGRDTVAHSLTWTLYAILRHPEVIGPLRQEIMALSTAEKESEPLSLDSSQLQSQNVPLLTAILHEALRFYPPVPFELKQCQESVVLPDGTFLPKNAVIVWCIWSMNRANETYGDDAETFRPSRWLDATGNFKSRSAFEYPVFNGGPRACLGKNMAIAIAAFTLISLFHEFDLKEVKDDTESGNERISANSLTLPMQGGLPCKIALRE